MNETPRRKFDAAERVTVTALTATALTGVATVLIASGLVSCETVEARPQKNPTTPATDYASPNAANSSSQPAGNVSPSSTAETSFVNSDPWLNVRMQLAQPFGSCVVRSYTNDGPSSNHKGQVVLSFRDTEFKVNASNASLRTSRTNGANGVKWSEVALAPAIIDQDGDVVDILDASTIATGSNGAPVASEAYLPATGTLGDTVVTMGLHTSASSPGPNGETTTTYSFTPCSGDSQLGFTDGSWRPVEGNDNLPLAILDNK